MSVVWQQTLPHLVHDLRALVRNTLLKGQLLQRSLGSNMSEESARLLTAVLETQQDLDQLLLRTAKLADADERGAGGEFLDLETVVLGAKLRVQPLLEQAGGTLLIRPLPDCQVPVKLEAVLTELLDNSVRFRHPDRPLQVQVAAEEVPAEVDRARLRITVADNGCGWPADEANRLFEPCRVLSGPEQLGQRRGAGLGLAIAQAILASAEGTITGKPRKTGSVFTILLPFEQSKNVWTGAD